jgi:mRNA-degrading endonuclease RelE of RelBE toxin-antitoxin system
MQTVAETAVFLRQAASLLSDAEKQDVISFLAANPYAGDEIVGTGGVRKVRVAANGKGKGGGARVIYYVLDDNTPIFALLIYGKSAKADLTSGERKAVGNLATAIKAQYRSGR